MSFGYSVSTQVGRVAPGEVDQVWAPRSPRSGTCGVILCHGAGNPSEFIDLTTQPSSVILAAALASAGIPCISGEFGGNTWANNTALSRVDAAWTVLQGLYPTMRTDKLCLGGFSMGGATVARYSQTYPAKVAAVVGLIPLWDLVAFYTTNVGGFASEVAVAWGTTSPNPLPSAADVAGNASAAAGIPTLAGYSTADQFITPSWVTSYVAAVGGTAIVTDTTAGHADAAVGGMPIATVGAFLAAHGA
jgi:hypothetical protein